MHSHSYPDIVDRLKEACNGHPAAKIAWPHRLLHDAIAEIERLRGVAQAPASPATAGLRAFASARKDAESQLGTLDKALRQRVERRMREESVSVAQAVPSRWRHKKRGTTYELLGNAIIQTETPLSDMDPVVVYRCEEDGTLWVRPGSEFLDGRFEELGDAS